MPFVSKDLAEIVTNLFSAPTDPIPSSEQFAVRNTRTALLDNPVGVVVMNLNALSVITVVTLLYLLLGVTAAQAESCLDDVASFALKICGEIANSGSRTIVDANGNLDANVSSIVRRVIGGGNASINGQMLYETYSGVLREQLSGAQFNVLDCRQKMVDVAVKQVCRSKTQNETTPKPSYSYLANASTLIEKDISYFQNVPKGTSQKGKLFGQINGYKETIYVDGKPKVLDLDIYFNFERYYLKTLSIFVEDGGADCLKTKMYSLMLALNANIWGQYRKIKEVTDSDYPGIIKGEEITYCGKDHTYMTYKIFWDKNPQHKFNDSAYLCMYLNYYDKYYEDIFYKCP
jgi:hypothetical protein